MKASTISSMILLKTTISNTTPNHMPPGLRRELWKVWFNLANAFRSNQGSNNQNWIESNLIYQQLCTIDTTKTNHPNNQHLIPIHALPLSGQWRACLNWASMSIRLQQWDMALSAFALGCANVAVDADITTAIDACQRVQIQQRQLHSSHSNNISLPTLQRTTKHVDSILKALLSKQQQNSFVTPIRINFLIPAWDEADSMTRSMTFLRTAAIRHDDPNNIKVVTHQPDITVITDDCATFGNRTRIHPSRLHPRSIRVRYEDECPKQLCHICLAKADVFLMSYEKEFQKYTTKFISKNASKVIIHTPHPADPVLFHGDVQKMRPINVLLTGCIKGAVFDMKEMEKEKEKENNNIKSGSTSEKTWIYPLRQRLANILNTNTKLGAKFRPHPGYGGTVPIGNRDYDRVRKNREQQLKEYALELTSAKIVLVTRSHRDYALRKYTEAAFAGSLLVGDIPTEQVSLFSQFVVEIKPTMSDQEIVDTLTWWLVHDKERILRARKGQQLVQHLTWSHKFKALLGGAILYRAGKYGGFTYEQALEAHGEWQKNSSRGASV